MLIEAAGYKGKYIDEIMAVGYATNDITSFTKQRKRWASGCIQMAKKYKISKQKGLNTTQKIEYLLCVSYWLFAIKRILYLILPMLYSIFNIVIIKANPIMFLGIWFPQYFLKRFILDRIHNNFRSSTWNKIYETILSPVLIITVLKELIGKSKKEFEVSDKKINNYKKSKTELKIVIPHILLLVVNMVTFFMCIKNIKEITSMIMSLIWSISNIWYLLIAIIFDTNNKETTIKENTKRMQNKVRYLPISFIKIFTKLKL